MKIRRLAPIKRLESSKQPVAGVRVGSRQRTSTYPVSGLLMNTDSCPFGFVGDRATTYSTDYTEACPSES
ncbi:hypothetical protein [Ferrimicrobium acidiphilum]|uniref:hypothetical protein n=1 Tax=Ferrimicrobium acidiphilum TaxID=121039 RepID=UPI001470483E|nr:hypothetical protein [Ferrimicrobium acidiphilum]